MDHRPRTTGMGFAIGTKTNRGYVHCRVYDQESQTMGTSMNHWYGRETWTLPSSVLTNNKFQISSLPSDNPESKERFRIVLLGVGRTYSELSELSDSEELFRVINLKYLLRFCLFKSLQLSFHTCSFSFVVYVRNNFFQQLFPPNS
jgi:hypothetical protein